MQNATPPAITAPEPPESDWITYEKAAELYGVSAKTIARAVKTLGLARKKLGHRTVRVSRSALAAHESKWNLD